MVAYTALSDNELVTRLAGDDNKAFETLYQRHARAMYQFAYRKMPVPHLVDDLLQDVFTNLYRKRASLGDVDNIKAYLFNAIRYRVLNELRNSLLHLHHQQQLPVAQVTEAAVAYDLHLLEKRFGEALEKLTERSREIFLLSRRDQLSYKEISERLGISVKAVEKHMSKSLLVMRQELKDYGLAGLACIAIARHLL